MTALADLSAPLAVLLAAGVLWCAVAVWRDRRAEKAAATDRALRFGSVRWERSMRDGEG